MTGTDRPWWKDASVYQIYPASYQDSNGDGIGDLPGISSRLGYIKSIGVDVIWICPMYESPQIDMGYDISDYQAVHKPYGTLQDMDDLISEAHAHGMKIILDLVVNHTSDQHAWFKESRSSKQSPKRDWYIWRPAKHNAEGEREPPNNWRSNFGGSAWEWDESTQEYYLHLFCMEQPDLNWENFAARRAIYESAMVFWLERGVDGFRIDTVNMYSKPTGLPDAPITDPTAKWQEAGLTYCNGPHMKQYLEEMNDILSQYDAMTVGECPFTDDVATVVSYVSAATKRLNMVFQFDVVNVGHGTVFKYQTTPHSHTLADLKQAIATTQNLLDGTDAWTTSFVENHDQARSISRFGDDSPKWRETSGKMLALLFASLSGTLFIYQGQEIGMINVPHDWPIEEYKDVDSVNYYKMVAERSHDDPVELAGVKAALQNLARDNARTPMQWTPAPNGGFTDDAAEPWMRVNTSTKEINVAEQMDREDSVLAFWRRMLEVRKTHADVLVDGRFELVDAENGKVLTFVKHGKGRYAMVVCNFSSSSQSMPDLHRGEEMRKVIGNVEDKRERGALQPWEGRLYLVDVCV